MSINAKDCELPPGCDIIYTPSPTLSPRYEDRFVFALDNPLLPQSLRQITVSPNHIPVQQQPTSPSSAVALSLECVVSLLLSLHTLFTKLLSSCPPTIIINSRETNAERIQNCWHLNKRRTKLTRYNIIINTPSHTSSTVTSSAFSCLFADLLYWMEILR